MPRPYREHKSEIFTDTAKNATPAQPIQEHWHNNYKDCVKLGEELLVNHIRMNPKLRSNIYNRRRFVENKDDGIYFNFLEFNEGYRTRFIDPDFEGYCMKFMESLRPALADFVKKIGYGAYGFQFKFRLNGRLFESSMTVFPGNPAR